MNSHSLLEGAMVDFVCKALNIHATNSLAAGATTWYSMMYWKHASFVIELTTTTGDTLNVVKLWQATDSSGTGNKAVTGYQFAPTTTTVAGDKVTLEFDASQLDWANGFCWIRPEIRASGGSVGTCNCVLIRSQPRYSYRSRSGAKVRLPQDLDAAS